MKEKIREIQDVVRITTTSQAESQKAKQTELKIIRSLLKAASVVTEGTTPSEDEKKEIAEIVPALIVAESRIAEEQATATSVAERFGDKATNEFVSIADTFEPDELNQIFDHLFHSYLAESDGMTGDHLASVYELICSLKRIFVEH